VRVFSRRSRVPGFMVTEERVYDSTAVGFQVERKFYDWIGLSVWRRWR